MHVEHDSPWGAKQRRPKRRRAKKPFDQAWLRDDLASIVNKVELSDEEKHFLSSRWLESIVWMEGAAQRSQRLYYVLRSTTAVGAVVVPALVSLNVIGSAKAAVLWVTFGISLVAGICAALEGFFRLGDRWRHYRLRVEELKTAGWDFYELAGAYANAKDHHEAFHTFAANVQTILAQEVAQYIAEIAKAPAGDKS
jgi:hypothetical protein